MPYERPNIQALSPYVSGEQPSDARTIKLNTNESPYPPSPRTLDAIQTVTGEQLRRYPPPTAASFRRAAAEVHGLEPIQVFATNAGDELLRMVLTVFTDPQQSGRGIAITEPTYSLYRVLANIHDTPVQATPLEDDFSIPATWPDTQADIGIAFVVNPHAPSGRLESLDTLRRIAESLRGRGVLLIDEAYVDFAERSALPLLGPDSDLDNVLLLRTMSKGYGLAGLRFAYGLGHPRLIEALDKARDSFNTDFIAQVAAEAAIRDQADARAKWDLILRDRGLLTQGLRDRGFTVPESQTNFALATVPSSGPDARTMYERLKENAILVRYFDQDRLRDKLRITVGTPEQNQTLLETLDRILHPQKV